MKDNEAIGIKCVKCEDEIWSRYTHDFRYCKCKAVAIDGGRSYTRIVGELKDWVEIFFTFKPDGTYTVRPYNGPEHEQ